MQDKDDALEIDLQVFVISLGTVPRNRELLAQVTAQGFSPRLVDAIDGRSWSYPFDSDIVNVKRFQKITGRRPTGPEIGCALSHLKCAQLAGKSKYALVMEDDAKITDDIYPALRAMQKLDKDNPVIVQLYSSPKSVLKRRTLTKLERNTDGVIARFFIPPHGAVAYLMNRSAIDVFASKKIVEGVADWPPYAQVFEFWGYFPSPVGHDSNDSTIEQFRKDMIPNPRFRNIYLHGALIYFRLFRISRVMEHSRILGGFGKYLKSVIWPHTSYFIRSFKSTTHEEDSYSIKLR